MQNQAFQLAHKGYLNLKQLYINQEIFFQSLRKLILLFDNHLNKLKSEAGPDEWKKTVNHLENARFFEYELDDIDKIISTDDLQQVLGKTCSEVVPDDQK